MHIILKNNIKKLLWNLNHQEPKCSGATNQNVKHDYEEDSIKVITTVRDHRGFEAKNIVLLLCSTRVCGTLHKCKVGHVVGSHYHNTIPCRPPTINHHNRADFDLC